jgi:hypothetical protein
MFINAGKEDDPEPERTVCKPVDNICAGFAKKPEGQMVVFIHGTCIPMVNNDEKRVKNEYFYRSAHWSDSGERMYKPGCRSSRQTRSGITE